MTKDTLGTHIVHAERQSATWILVTPQDIDQRGTSLLSRCTSVQDGGNIGVIRPGHPISNTSETVRNAQSEYARDRAHRMHNDNRVGVDSSDLFDLKSRQIHPRPESVNAHQTSAFPPQIQIISITHVSRDGIIEPKLPTHRIGKHKCHILSTRSCYTGIEVISERSGE